MRPRLVFLLVDAVLRTIEAIVNEEGKVQLLEAIALHGPRRALVTILDEDPPRLLFETALLSEQALFEDWNRPQEDAAWSHLQPPR